MYFSYMLVRLCICDVVHVHMWRNINTLSFNFVITFSGRAIYLASIPLAVAFLEMESFEALKQYNIPLKMKI